MRKKVEQKKYLNWISKNMYGFNRRRSIYLSKENHMSRDPETKNIRDPPC